MARPTVAPADLCLSQQSDRYPKLAPAAIAHAAKELGSAMKTIWGIVAGIISFVFLKVAEEASKELWPMLKETSKGIDWQAINLIFKNDIYAQKLFLDLPLIAIAAYYVLKGNKHEDIAHKFREFTMVLLLVPAATFMFLLGANLLIGNDTVTRSLKDHGFSIAIDAVVIAVITIRTLQRMRSANRSIWDT